MKKKLLSGILALVMALAMFPVAAMAATPETEPNDAAATAMPIQVNQEYTGGVSTTSDKDYYAFTLTQNEVVTLSYDFSSGRSNQSMILMDSGSTTIASARFNSDTVAFPYTTNRYNLPAGKYYVIVSHYGGDLNTGAYTITVKTESQVSNREFEYNDAMSVANVIDVNKKYVGNLSNDSDKDYYKFTIPGNGLVTLTYEATGGRSNMSTILYDSGSQAVFSNRFNSDTAVFPHTSLRYRLPAGTYYVLVNHYGGDPNNSDYYITVNYTDESGQAIEVEYNNDTTTANPIAINTALKGNLSNDSDKDYYKFTLDSQRNITIIYSATGGRSNMNVALYDSSSKHVLSSRFNSDNVSFPFSLETTTLTAGTYYVIVNHYGGDLNNSDYTITVSDGGSPTQPPPTPTPTPTGPAPGGFTAESTTVGIKLR